MAITKLTTEIQVVVDFAVGDNELVATLVEDRLAAAVKIDDRESTVDQRQRAIVVKRFFVGSAIREQLAHARENRTTSITVEPRVTEGQKACKTAQFPLLA